MDLGRILKIFLFASLCFIFPTEVLASTEVGGIINQDTVWTKNGSPYLVTSTVQIPQGVNLNIEPGVTVISQQNVDNMFLLAGTINAQGKPGERITFEGKTSRVFFKSAGGFVNASWCEFKNGGSFWWSDAYGYFYVKYSNFNNLADYSYIWYPNKDVFIEYNKLINCGGFSIGHAYANVYVRYNEFYGKQPNLPDYKDFIIENWASYNNTKTIVKYNSFLDMTGIVLKLPPGYNSASMVATENYWGTTDPKSIDSMIYDKNDYITCAGYIEYLPILLNSIPKPKPSIMYPYHESKNVPVDSKVYAAFEIPPVELSDSAHITINNYSVSTKNIAFNNNILYLGHEPFAYNTLYNIIISEGSVASVVYKTYNDEISWSFTTVQEVNAPIILKTDPAAHATSVAVDKTITITFSEPVQAGSTLGSVTLNAGESVVQVVYSVSGDKLAIDPVNNLNYGTQYMVTIPAGAVKDLAGNDLAEDYSFDFATTNSGCFIATAAYGSYLDPHVQVLRDFRDQVLLRFSWGRWFVEQYYRYSPPASEIISRQPTLKAVARFVLAPVVFTISYPKISIVALIFLINGGVILLKRKI